MKNLRRESFRVMSKALDPDGPFLRKCNKIFLVSCVVAACLDPLLFYTPLVDADQLCIYLDNKLAITLCVLRSFNDLFFVFRIFLKFRTGIIAPSSRVFGSGQLVMDWRSIMIRYLHSYFIIDVLSILPLPQVVTVIVPSAAVRSWIKIRLLTILITVQNLVRILRLIPLLNEVTKTSAILTETVWSGATLNFCLYMFASHVIGSFWYLASVERTGKCWRVVCSAHTNCSLDDLYCGAGGQLHGNYNPFLVSSSCMSKPFFDYGIFFDALSLQLYTDFFRRFFYCFVWGLRNLSSLGQNLQTSNNIGENLFVVLISVNGLILFSILAGNIQRCLQSVTVRLDEMVVKKRDQEQWMSRTLLPQDLRDRVRQHEQYKWRKNRGVDDESLIRNLPKDLRRDIKRHQCISLLMRVPLFEKMDGMHLDALCCRLKPVLYSENTYICREADPVDEFLFIKRGKILSITTNVGTFNTRILKLGDFCGEELLTWALDPNSSSSTLPISTTTFQAINNVEAFTLMSDDLKYVVSQFRLRYLHTHKSDHIFRFYSPQWKSWGASTIQAAWRRYYSQSRRGSFE